MVPLKYIRGIRFFVLGGAGFIAFVCATLLPFDSSAQSDLIPPQLKNIQVISVTATSAVVIWETDEEAESVVNYGLDKNYGTARDPVANKKNHRITITDLEPSTLYHFRSVSSDIGGNQAVSGDYTILTKGKKPRPELKNLQPDEKANVERAIDAIEEIQTVAGIKAVAQVVGESAKKIIEAPVVIGKPNVDEIGSDYAVISWATDQEANSIVEFAEEGIYDPNNPDSYTVKQGEQNEEVKDHVIRAVGFKPGTKYHFRVTSESSLGLTGVSRDQTLVSKALLPTILQFRATKIEEYAATLGWTTTIPAKGVIEYTNLKTKEAKTIGKPVLSTTGTIRIYDLKLGTKYSAILKVENELGDRVTSNPISFTTVKDTAPPEIAKVANESTLYPQAEAKVQTIVSWSTDEPAYCTFYYRAGLSQGLEPSKLDENKEPKTTHVQVIVEFLPSTVYKYWVECRDPAGNKSKSEDFVLFTPNKEKSIIDIILENFQGTFGWVKNIGK